MKTTTVLTLTSLLLATAAPLSAETLRWARSGDALTLDPHAQNEGPTHTIRHQMYEPLIIRDVTGAFELGAGDRMGAQGRRSERLGVQAARRRDLP